jgi:hypothetical protein
MVGVVYKPPKRGDGTAPPHQSAARGEETTEGRHMRASRSQDSGWLPKIPRVNHMSEIERLEHLSNVGARRRREVLLQYSMTSDADMRARRQREAGPGVQLEDLSQLSQFSRTQTLGISGKRRDAILKDMKFIEACKRQVVRLNKFDPFQADDRSKFPPRHMKQRGRERETAQGVHRVVALSTTGGMVLEKICTFMDLTGTTMTGAFAQFDLDGSGEIDAAELQAALRRIGLELDSEEIGLAMREIDGDFDGQITAKARTRSL